jgi:hypothetical protein
MCKKIKRISYFSTNPHDQNTFKLEEHPTVGWTCRILEPIHRSAGGEGVTILHSNEEVGEVSSGMMKPTKSSKS